MATMGLRAAHAGVASSSAILRTSGGASSSVLSSRDATGLLAAHFHSSAPAQSTLLVGSLSLAAAALAGSYAIRAYNSANPSEEAPAEQVAGEAAKPSTSHKTYGAEMFARRFYRGPFDDKMSKREASLILGVRESASPERIRERYKKMLILNHPDMGGSTYIAGKINEAKDLLLGKRMA
jgi:DnaJ family protein C protein 19